MNNMREAAVTELRYVSLHKFMIWLAWGWTLIDLCPGSHGEHSVIMERAIR